MKRLVTVLFLTASALLAQPASAQDPVFIDVRTWAEHQLDYIEGDPRIHVSDIIEGVAEAYPNKTTPIRLYCARGVRAQSAAERLKDAGYLDVENAGGINAVRAARFPDLEK